VVDRVRAAQGGAVTRPLLVRKLGVVEYEDGLAMQKQLAAARHAGAVPDTLLLLEHQRVITLGRGAARENILWSDELLAERGFEVHHTDRGGDVTYHGPGQLVGYPILDLKPDRKDVRRYVRSVEELMIRIANDYQIKCERIEGRTGVWVPPHPLSASRAPAKLGAIGVHLSRWITTHGFAFNVDTDLTDFGAIVPCGIRDAGVTCLADLLGDRHPPMEEVVERAVFHAGSLWESETAEALCELETISMTVLREGHAGDEVLLLERIESRGGFWQTLTGRRHVGEPALVAAARELFEETGFAPPLDEIADLHYAHAFAIDPSLVLAPAVGDETEGGAQAEERAKPEPRAPIFARETAFAVRVPPGSEPRLDPREHQAHRWVSAEDAIGRLRFAGLRRGVKLAEAELGPAAPKVR